MASLAVPHQMPLERRMAFEVRSSDGQLLVEAVVSPSKLAIKRALWRSWTRAAVLGTFALTLIFGAGPLIKWRRAARAPRAVVAATVAIVATACAARALLWLAMSPLIGRALDAPLALLPNALFLAGIAWLAIDSLERWRVGPPRTPLRTASGATLVHGRDRLRFSQRSEPPLLLWSVRAAAAIDCRALVVRSAAFLTPPDRGRPVSAWRSVSCFFTPPSSGWPRPSCERRIAWLRLPRTSRFIAVRSGAAGGGHRCGRARHTIGSLADSSRPAPDRRHRRASGARLSCLVRTDRFAAPRKRLVSDCCFSPCSCRRSRCIPPSTRSRRRRESRRSPRTSRLRWRDSARISSWCACRTRSTRSKPSRRWLSSSPGPRRIRRRRPTARSSSGRRPSSPPTASRPPLSCMDRTDVLSAASR